MNNNFNVNSNIKNGIKIFRKKNLRVKSGYKNNKN